MVNILSETVNNKTRYYTKSVYGEKYYDPKYELYLNAITKLNNDIKQSNNPDIFLADYQPSIINMSITLPNQYIAKCNLKKQQNGYLGKLIDALETLDMEIMINGTVCFAAIVTPNSYSFQNDVTLHIKNITSRKIIILDEKIRSAFSDYNVCYVRRPFTITWWIYENNNNKSVVLNVSLNLCNVRSWAEVFINNSYDLSSVGYDTLNKKFVVLLERWYNFTSNFYNSYVSNINNFDDLDYLKTIEYDLGMNNMNCIMLYLEKNLNIVIKQNKRNSRTTNLFDVLISIYKNINNNIIISDSIDELFESQCPYPYLMDATNLKSDDRFLSFVSKYECADGYECPIVLEKHHYLIANRNCMHDVSMVGFINVNTLTKCPICEKNIDPVMYNFVSEKRNDVIKNKQNNKQYNNRNFDIKNFKTVYFKKMNIPDAPRCCGECIRKHNKKYGIIEEDENENENKDDDNNIKADNNIPNEENKEEEVDDIIDDMNNDMNNGESDYENSEDPPNNVPFDEENEENEYFEGEEEAIRQSLQEFSNQPKLGAFILSDEEKKRYGLDKITATIGEAFKNAEFDGDDLSIQLPIQSDAENAVSSNKNNNNESDPDLISDESDDDIIVFEKDSGIAPQQNINLMNKITTFNQIMASLQSDNLSNNGSKSPPVVTSAATAEKKKKRKRSKKSKNNKYVDPIQA